MIGRAQSGTVGVTRLKLGQPMVIESKARLEEDG
jgi:hypothetical protein